MNTLLFNVPITCNSWKAVMKKILRWAEYHESRSVGICNLHVDVFGATDPEHPSILTSNDINNITGRSLRDCCVGKGGRNRRER